MEKTFTRTSPLQIGGAPGAMPGFAKPATSHSFERQGRSDNDGSDKIDGGEERVLQAPERVEMALENQAIVLDTESRLGKSELDMELFMAEELEVVLHDPANETEPEVVELRVNGHYVAAKRDSTQPVKMRRYHVAVLAQSKTARLVQESRTDPDGFKGYREKVALRLSYPFSVQHDPSGARGRAWLKNLVTSATA